MQDLKRDFEDICISSRPLAAPWEKKNLHTMPDLPSTRLFQSITLSWSTPETTVKTLNSKRANSKRDI